jgi:hypothetical protein
MVTYKGVRVLHHLPETDVMTVDRIKTSNS